MVVMNPRAARRRQKSMRGKWEGRERSLETGHGWSLEAESMCARRKKPKHPKLTSWQVAAVMNRNGWTTLAAFAFIAFNWTWNLNRVLLSNPLVMSGCTKSVTSLPGGGKTRMEPENTTSKRGASFRFGVNLKISLVIVIISSLTLISFTAYDYTRAEKDVETQLMVLSERIINRMAFTLRTPAWDMNRQSLILALQSEMNNRNVAYIGYKDNSDPHFGVFLGRESDGTVTQVSDRPLDAPIQNVSNIKVQDNVLGVVHVGITDVFERATITSRVTWFFLRLLLLEALLVLALYLSMRLLFIRPVSALSRLAETMTREKDFSLEAKGGGNDEIGLLVRNFNSLIGEVRSREEQLQSSSRLLEKKVEARTRELAEKARELEASNKRLQQLDAMKDAILTTVSHELRTPLTSILGFAVIIRKNFNKFFAVGSLEGKEKDKRVSQINQNLTIIDEEGRRLTRLINDFLDLSKIEEGKASWNDEPVDLTELTHRAVQKISGQLPDDSEIILHANLSDEPAIMRIDPDRYNQVLLNLMNNALKFTRKGSVTISSKLSPENIFRVCISDTGIGIAQDQLQGLFEKFHQVLGKEHETNKGTGLGLTISRQIVKHYHGIIWVESELGRGSRFYFELPLDAGN